MWTVNILAEWRFSIKEDEGRDGDQVPENISFKLTRTLTELDTNSTRTFLVGSDLPDPPLDEDG